MLWNTFLFNLLGFCTLFSGAVSCEFQGVYFPSWKIRHDMSWLYLVVEKTFSPTCQVRVVRFYVSLFFSSFSFSLRPRLPSPCPVAILCVQCGMSDLNCDPVSSVWRAGLQPRSCECSVAYRTPTAILRVSVWRTGPQPRSCQFGVACRTPTAIPACSVWRPGPQLWSRLFSAVCRTSSIVSENLSERYVRRYVRKNVKRYVRKMSERNVRRYVRKNVKRYVRKNVKRYVRKNVRR